MSRAKSLDKAVGQLVALKDEAISIVGDDRNGIALISENYDELDSPNQILETYLKVLVSLMPDLELLCKKKVSEYNIRALTMLGDSLRQTITELEVYKDPNITIDEKITPSIQVHHDEVIRKIAEHVSKMKNSLFELFPVEKHTQAQALLIDFLRMLGEDLRKTYENTTAKLKEDLLNVRGL